MHESNIHLQKDINRFFFLLVFFVNVCSWSDMGPEKKDDLWACVDEPQAHFLRTSFNLRHNSHRTSGQEEALGLHSNLINMDERKLHIYCMHNLLAFLISISYICFLFFFFLPLQRTMEEMVDVQPRGIHLFYSSNFACVHSALFQPGYQISLCCAAARLFQI